MADLPKTVFVTRYALSRGIQEREICRFALGDKPVVKQPGAVGGEALLWTGEFAFDRDAAVKQAEAMRAKKLAALKRQIDKLEALTFS